LKVASAISVYCKYTFILATLETFLLSSPYLSKGQIANTLSYLRHWKLTAYVHAKKDPFQVQLFTRHKDMKCTMRYVHLESVIYQKSSNDDWTVRAAKTAEEAMDLLKVGFDYVTDFEGLKIFRKRN
jgi:hypothetical protein